MIPGLEHATFLRYGQIHRNTYIHAPSLLTETLQLKAALRRSSSLASFPVSKATPNRSPAAFSQAAIAAALARGEKRPSPAPRLSANGSLTHYITHAGPRKFQPANITFDLLVPLEDDLRKKIRDKKERHRLQCDRALEAWDAWLAASSTKTLTAA